MLYYKPEPPTNVADDSAKRTETSIYVTFTETPVADWNGGDVNEYELYRLGAAGDWVYMASSATAYFDLQRYIAACTTYNFTVTAMNGYGESNYSTSYKVNNAGPPSKMDSSIARARNTDSDAFDVTITWGSETYDAGGCTLIGVGYWEHSAWNTTNAYCYVAHEAYNETARTNGDTIPAVTSHGPPVHDYCNFNATENNKANITMAQYTDYTMFANKTSTFASDTPSDALGTVYYVDYPTGGGGGESLKMRDYDTFTFSFTDITSAQKS